MNFFINMMLAVAAAAASISCSSVFDMDKLTGAHGQEWQLTAIDGKPVAQTDATPYLGFKDSLIWGFTGCNRLTGGTVSADGHTDFSHTAATMRLCPEAVYEAPMLDALSRATTAKVSRRRLVLYDTNGHDIMILKPRPTTVTDLSGRWLVTAIGGKTVETLRQDTPRSEGEPPWLQFNVAERKVTGYTGCNRIFGDVSGDELKRGRLDFSKLAVTRMLCQDGKLEQNMLAALRQVRSYVLLDGRLSFLDGKDTEVMALTHSGDEP